MKRLFATIFIALALVPWLAGCQRELTHEDGRALLRKISEARVDTAVKGTVTTYILAGGKEVNADARIHRGAGRMQMEFVSGEPKGSKILQQGGFVWQVAPDGKAVRRLPHNPADQMPNFGEGAVVTVAPGPRVAGYATDRVVFRPGAESGARLELLVDRATRFPLVSEKYSNTGALVARTAFTEAEFGVEPPAEVEPPKAEMGREWLAETTKVDLAKAKKILSGEPVEPSYTPAGMKNTGYYLHKRGPLTGIEIRYSDGVRLLSVITFRKPERVREHPATGEKTQEQANEAVQGMVERNPQLRERWNNATPEQREKMRERLIERRRQRQAEGGNTGDGSAGSVVPHNDAERGPTAEEELGPPPDAIQQREQPAKQESADDDNVRGSRVHGRVARLRVGKFMVVVHGDLPADELQKVVASMRENPTAF